MLSITGLNGNPDSIWKPFYTEGTSAGIIAKTDQVGLIIQLLVLVAAVAMTGFYIYSRKVK